MYGTIARLRTKPGMSDQLGRLTAEYGDLDLPGHVATYLVRLDSGPDDHYVVAIFSDRETYARNAESPEQHDRYLRMREVLAQDPEWHDGEVAWSRASG